MQDPHLLAPVALFVYNRPEHTLRTVDALAKNRCAEKTRLYVFCDGPRGGDEHRVKEVLAIVTSLEWPGDKTVIARDENFGLAASIRGGIEQVLAENDRVIVLEDDIVVSPGFLEYMNLALTTYASEETVTAVCGFLPRTVMGWLLPKTFFLSHFECWGWGTWRRVWKELDWDANRLYDRITESREHLDKFDFNNSADFSRHLRANAEGSMRTWAIYFQANAFLRGGLSFFPGKSLVQNIGCDSSGVNCDAGIAQLYSTEITDRIEVQPQRPRESRRARWYFNYFFRHGQQSLVVIIGLMARQFARRVVSYARHRMF